MAAIETVHSGPVYTKFRLPCCGYEWVENDTDHHALPDFSFCPGCGEKVSEEAAFPLPALIGLDADRYPVFTGDELVNQVTGVVAIAQRAASHGHIVVLGTDGTEEAWDAQFASKTHPRSFIA